MNTPPKPVRFKGFDLGKMESGSWTGALLDPEYQKALGDIAASYEHLETNMPHILAVLMGTGDHRAAGYVYRSIKSPKARSELMWHLLESAPHNKDMPVWFDQVLSAHDGIRKRRNNYVHGLWSHKAEDGSTWLAVFPEHGGWTPDASSREPLENLHSLVADTRELNLRILHEVWPFVQQLVEQRQEQVLKDVERQKAKAARLAAEAPQPQPAPSEE